MGPEIVVIALVALLFPILLLLGAVLLDILVVLYVAFRWGHDRAVPGIEDYVRRHVTAPVGRFARSHRLLPRPH